MMRQSEDIQSVQIESLTRRLDLANFRISELEAVERRLNIEIEDINRSFKQALNTVVTNNSFDNIYPSHNINMFMSITDIVQRRDVWIKFLIDLGVIDTRLSSAFPHNGSVDSMMVLMRGSGGFGDMIYMSAIIKNLYDKFPGSRFFVLHEHPAAHIVFKSNPYVIDTIILHGDRHVRFLNGIASIDVFDLVVDVRYVVTYAAPPLSRVDAEFLRTAHSRSAPWQKYVRREWPYLNNLLASEAGRRGMGKLDLAGYTSLLDLNKSSFGDIFPSDVLRNDLTSKFDQRAYMTVHTGADPNMAGVDGLQTKNLSLDQWKTIVSACEAGGFLTVQLGDLNEHLIDGVGLDLRGVTSFEETALIIKQAQVHIDTEGGLVHLARAVGTTSVVAFGPTPSLFFGYDGNVNIDPSDCGDCWWTVPTWSVNCPLGLPGPACMASHTPGSIASQALKVARYAKRLEHLEISQPIHEIHGLFKIITLKLLTAGKSNQCAIVSPEILTHQDFATVCSPRFSITHFIPAQCWADLGWADIGLIRPYNNSHVPAASSASDWLVLDLKAAERGEIITLLMEAARVVKIGGIVTVFWPSCTVDTLSIDHLEEMIGLALGQRLVRSIVKVGTENSLLGSLSNFRMIAVDPEISIHSKRKDNLAKSRLSPNRLFRRK